MVVRTYVWWLAGLMLIGNVLLAQAPAVSVPPPVILGPLPTEPSTTYANSPASRPVRSEAEFSASEQLRQTIESLEMQVQLLRQMVAQSAGVSQPLQRALQSYRRGRDLSELKLYRAAIEEFSNALALDPTNESALMLRGEAYFRIGDFPSAEDDFNASLDRQPDNSRAFLGRAQARNARGKLAEAMADIKEVLRRDAMNAEARLLRARLYELDNDFPSAVADYTAVLRMTPSSEQALSGRATMYLRAGQFDLATVDCQTAAKLNPNAPWAHLCMAEIHLRQRSVEQAVASLNSAMNAAQLTGQPMPIIAGIAPAAIQVAQPAPVAVPAPKPIPPPPVVPAPVVVAENVAPVQAPKPASVRAEPKAAEVRPAPKAAAPVVKQVAASAPPPKQSPTKVAAEYDRQARELINQHKYADALELLNLAVQQAPKYARAINARGFAYLMMEQYELAIIDFTEAIRINPTYANAFHNRAVARRKMLDMQAADEDDRIAAKYATVALAIRP